MNRGNMNRGNMNRSNMNRIRKTIASLAIAGMTLTIIPLNALAEGSFPTRIAGRTAVQTAVAIADRTGWTDTAILASSDRSGLVDSLIAGPLATFLKAPILLTGTGDVLNPDTRAELERLKVKKIYVTSGTALISQGVLNEIQGMGIDVESLAGADRFATSANIAQKMVDLGATVSKAAVAYGRLYQDALSIAPIASAQTAFSVGPIASAQAMPILLTEKDSVPASIQAFLKANPSVQATDVIGGTAVVSQAVEAQLPSPTRIYGNTAYDTNLAVLKAFDSLLKYDHVFVANGETGIDALSGAPLAAMYNAGIVLIDGTRLNEGTAYAASKLSATSVVTALGGLVVVPDAILDGIVYVAPSDNNKGHSGQDHGGSKTKVTISSFAIKDNSNHSVGTVSGTTVDLSSIANNDQRIKALDITASPADSTLKLTEIACPTGNISFKDETFSLAGPITMTDIFGKNLIQDGDVSLRSLRALFGSTVTFKGVLTHSGYASSDVALTLDLGTTGAPITNNWDDMTVDKTNHVVTATIKTSQESTLLDNIGVGSLFIVSDEVIPKSISTHAGGPWNDPSTNAGRNRIKAEVTTLTGAASWGSATLNQLRGKTIYFQDQNNIKWRIDFN